MPSGRKPALRRQPKFKSASLRASATELHYLGQSQVRDHYGIGELISMHDNDLRKSKLLTPQSNDNLFLWLWARAEIFSDNSPKCRKSSSPRDLPERGDCAKYCNESGHLRVQYPLLVRLLAEVVSLVLYLRRTNILDRAASGGPQPTWEALTYSIGLWSPISLQMVAGIPSNQVRAYNNPVQWY